jgi:hypothetical protein
MAPARLPVTRDRESDPEVVSIYDHGVSGAVARAGPFFCFAPESERLPIQLALGKYRR